MKIEEIFEKYRMLEIYEERNQTADYTELVFYKRHIDEWDNIFSDLLGPAIKPAGKSLQKEALAIAKVFGGIRKEQTLYQKKIDNVSIVAMFWPWQDDIHTTLKVFLKKD